jgi:mRNA interferase MazF
MESSQKQIWLINFDPSFGREYQKMRPGIIVENNFYIDKFDLLTIIPISSKINNKFYLDIIIPKTLENRLLYDSIIKTKQINSFDKRRFINYIGNCEESIFNALQNNLFEYLR